MKHLEFDKSFFKLTAKRAIKKKLGISQSSINLSNNEIILDNSFMNTNTDKIKLEF